jgi:hypothetical protein
MTEINEDEFKFHHLNLGFVSDFDIRISDLSVIVFDLNCCGAESV